MVLRFPQTVMTIFDMCEVPPCDVVEVMPHEGRIVLATYPCPPSTFITERDLVVREQHRAFDQALALRRTDCGWGK
jgi:hypothetical protein